MIGLGHEPMFQLVGLMSALPLEADFLLDQGNVGFVPLADIAPTGRGIALERGYLCEMHRFIAVVACEE